MASKKLDCATCKKDTAPVKMNSSQTQCSCGLHRKSSTTDEPVEWTVVHGYYATMGGFVFDLDAQNASTILNADVKDGITRLTISPQGLQLLAECGLIPDIETREILDKNKSDGLAKFLVILQASWMVVQCISRLAYSLPVTLLEVNTIGHVICALFIYTLWWKKPREVTEPTIIQDSWVPAICAYMVMSSDKYDVAGWLQWTALHEPQLPEFSNLTFQREQCACLSYNTSSSSLTPTVAEDDSFTIKAQKSGFGFLGLTGEPEITTGVKKHKSFQHNLDLSKVERQTSTARWTLSLDAMEMFPHLRCRVEKLQTSIKGPRPDYQSQVMLQDRASNWPSRGSIPPYQGKLVGMALWFASIAFGAVHIAAWGEYFPSTLEKWLWRSSAIYLAWAGGLWLTICLLGALSKGFSWVWDKCLAGKAPLPVYICLVPICTICGTVYAFARVFLVIESIISLRQMPPSVYLTPNWPQVIPHL